MNLLAVNPVEHIGEIEHDFLPHLDERNFSSLRDPGVDCENAEAKKCGELFFVEELSLCRRLSV